MSKFCNNCGSQLEDQSTFCPNCGTACAASEEAKGGNVVDKVTDMGKDYVKKAKSNKMLIIIPIVAVLLIVGIILAISLIPSYKDPIESTMKIYYAKGTKSMIKNQLPKEVWEYVKDVKGEDHEDYWKDYEEDLDDRKDALEDEYGKNYKVSFKVTDKDEIKGDDLTEIKDTLKEYYDIDKKSVKKAYKVDLEWEIKGSEDDEDDEIEDFVVVKIGGKWYSYSSVISEYMGPVEEAKEQWKEMQKYMAEED